MFIPIMLFCCLVAYALSRWLTGLSRNWALRHGIVSHVTHRSSHSVPTARLGGVGLALGFGLAALLFFMGLWILCPSNHFLNGFSCVVLLCTTFGWFSFLAVGVLDDLHDLSPLVKLALFFIAALIPLILYFAIVIVSTNRYTAAEMYASALFLGLIFVWILFFVNAFNFMDGMDGFAAGFAGLASLFLWGTYLVRIFGEVGEIFSIDDSVAIFCLLPMLAAACWGFLHWNNPPAKIFMGDGGSLSLGFLLAAFVTWGCQQCQINTFDALSQKYVPQVVCLIPPLIPLTVLLPFIFDVTLTLIRRARRGENLLKAHREHLYQRLMKTGLAHAEVLKIAKRTFWACGLLALAGAWFRHPAARWIAFTLALGVMVGYWRFVLARERAAQRTES